MFDPESIDVALGVAPGVQQLLADGQNVAWEAREAVVRHGVAVEEATQAVAAAKEALKNLKASGRQLEVDKQRADSRTERIGNRLAAEVLLQPGMDDVSRALFSIIYHDRRNAWKVGVDNNPYDDAIKAGGQAMASIAERLKPGEPILYFDRGDPVVARTPNDPLIADLPPHHYTRTSLDEIEVGGYLNFDLGTIYLDMPSAVTARSKSQDLVAIEDREEPSRATLISQMYEEGIERLERAATNDQTLVIGGQAIKGFMEKGLDGSGGTREHLHLPVATAMTARGLEVPFKLSSALRAETKKTLVELVAFIASGGARETVNEERRGRWQEKTVAVDKDPLYVLSTEIDLRSIRYMATTIGLRKTQLKDSVNRLLGSKIEDDSTSLNDLGKGLASRRQLNDVVNQIFKS